MSRALPGGFNSENFNYSRAMRAISRGSSVRWGERAATESFPVRRPRPRSNVATGVDYSPRETTRMANKGPRARYIMSSRTHKKTGLRNSNDIMFAPLFSRRSSHDGRPGRRRRKAAQGEDVEEVKRKEEKGGGGKGERIGFREARTQRGRGRVGGIGGKRARRQPGRRSSRGEGGGRRNPPTSREAEA